MKRKIACIAGLAVMLLSACTNDEEDSPYVVAEFETQIYQSVIFQAENRVYLFTTRNLREDDPTEVYRVDLLSKQKTRLFTSEGSPYKFIISDDEKLIAISVVEPSSTAGYTSRLELFDLSTGNKTVLRTVHDPITPLGFDSDNQTLLYQILNDLRKIDLASGTDVLVSDNQSYIVKAIHPATRNILLSNVDGYYFMDWDGNVMDDPITHFVPSFFSQDGEKIIGSTLTNVVRYTMATGETEVLLTGSENEYSAVSISHDQSFVLCRQPDLELSNDLYVVDTESLEKKRLMATRDDEDGIGFFDDDRQVLFLVTYGERKTLYGMRID